MDEISKQIEQMAERMEKSSSEISTEDLSASKKHLFNVIKSLGSEGLKQKLPSLNDEEKIVLKAALEEMTLSKAVSFDKEAQSAKPIQGKVEDTIIQEEIASDDADEKLVKPEASDVKHQGTPTEGWEGQVIKASDEESEIEKGRGPDKQQRKPRHVGGIASGAGRNKYQDQNEKQSGINKPHAAHSAYQKKDLGTSEAGDHAKETYGGEKILVDSAKEKHKKVLSEMKNMPKPNLTKSQIDLIDTNIDEVIEKAMEKCNDGEKVMKKLKEKGMPEEKVQGALDKYKQKKDMKKSDEIEKGKMKQAREEAKEEIMSMEEEEHESKDPKKIVKEEKKEKKMKKSDEDVEKAKKILKEEDQLGDAPEMNEKTMGKKESAPDIEDNAKASKNAQKDVKNLKVKKSVSWEDDNRLFKSNVLGRNHSFNLESFIDETLKSADVATEEVKKSETKEDLNDIIAKSEDRNWDQIRDARRLQEHKTSGTLIKSFDEIKDLAASMGISEEEARKILGE